MVNKERSYSSYEMILYNINRIHQLWMIAMKIPKDTLDVEYNGQIVEKMMEHCNELRETSYYENAIQYLSYVR